jgi:hypothetical protein|tara:strand:+ start:4133 stop:4396 length:264 start_codon:yes stop_codon:yes gene_type:complete
MKADIRTLNEIMHDYMDTVYDGEKLSREQVDAVKGAFISGADVMLMLFQHLGELDIDDQELLEVVLDYGREIEEYIEDRLREQVERN